MTSKTLAIFPIWKVLKNLDLDTLGEKKVKKKCLNEILKLGL